MGELKQLNIVQFCIALHTAMDSPDNTPINWKPDEVVSILKEFGLIDETWSTYVKFD